MTIKRHVVRCKHAVGYDFHVVQCHTDRYVKDLAIDGLDHGDEKVVLEIGSRYLKCGLSGENSPRSIVRHTALVGHYLQEVFPSNSHSKEM